MDRREFIERLGFSTAAFAGGYLMPRFALADTARSGLPRSRPGEQGVSSAAILGFLDAAANAGIELHSFMLVCHGRIVAETWWAPYRSHATHWLYSRRFYETPHHDTVIFKIEGDDVQVQFLNSITAGLGANPSLHPETRPVLNGRLTA